MILQTHEDIIVSTSRNRMVANDFDLASHYRVMRVEPTEGGKVDIRSVKGGNLAVFSCNHQSPSRKVSS